MARIQYRRDSTANWAFYNPVLAAGEPAYDYQTEEYRLGNGVDRYLDLTPYTPGGGGGGGGVTLEQVQDDLGNTSLVAGTGITKTYSDVSNTITLAVTGSTYQPIDADLTTIAAANNGAVLAATTASFLTADETKLDGIEALADVTDTANVTSAGALMGSEVTNLAAVKAFDPADFIISGRIFSR